MGDAFTAVADDAAAIYRNPAGLSQLRRPEAEATATATNRDLTDRQESLSYARPLGDKAGGGFGYLHVEGSVIDSRRFFGSYGRLISDRLSLGLGLKLYAEDLSPAGYSDDSAATAGLDLGLLLTPNERWALGVLIRDVNQPEAEFANGQAKHAAVLRGGLAYRPVKGATVSADMEMEDAFAVLDVPTFSFGIEVEAVEGLDLRAGYSLLAPNRIPFGGPLSRPTAGLGFKIPRTDLFVDYAFIYVFNIEDPGDVSYHLVSVRIGL